MTTRVEIEVDAGSGVKRRWTQEVDTAAPERAIAAALRLAAQTIDPDTRCLKCGKTRALHRELVTGPVRGSDARECSDGHLFDPEPPR